MGSQDFSEAAGVTTADSHEEMPSTPRVKHSSSEQVSHWTFSRWLAFHPCRVFGVTMLVVLLLIGVTFGGGLFKMSPQTNYDFLITGHVDTDRMDAFDSSKSLGGGSTTAAAATQTVGLRDASFFFVYEMRDGSSVFSSPAAIKLMCEVESKLIGHSEWPNFCLKDGNGACQDFQSAQAGYINATITHFMYNTLAERTTSCPLLSQADVDAGLAAAKADGRSSFLFGKNEDWGRSFIMLGAPLKGYSNENDKVVEQTEKYEEFLIKVETEMLKMFGRRWGESAVRSPYMNSLVRDGVEVRWSSVILSQAEIGRMSLQDFVWAILSILWVLSLLFYHTKSFFLGGLGMLEIIFSFMCGFALYRLVLQVTYFSTMHILSIFILLGIGADDIFVFVDAWRQSSTAICTLDRIHEAYQRASKAMLVTSLTTAVAFFATAVSEIMPISTFGIFAAVAIIANYILVITLFPSLIMIHYRYLELYTFKDFIRCRFPKRRDGEVIALSADEEAPKASAGASGMKNEADQEHAHSDLSKLELWFRDSYGRFITQKKASIPVLAGFIVLLAVTAAFALQLRPPVDVERWFPTQHMIQEFTDNQNEFPAGETDNLVEIDVIWGVKGMNRKGLSRWDLEERGSPILDTVFNPAPEAAQEHILKTCEDLRTLPCKVGGCVGDVLVNAGEVRCAPELFANWMLSTTGSRLAPQADYTTKIKQFRDSSNCDATCKSDLGIIDNRVQYIAIGFKSTLRRRAPSTQSSPVYDLMEDFVESRNSQPSSPGEAFQTSEKWPPLRTEQAMLRNALFGMALCFPLSFVVLSLFTLNVIIGFYGILSIVGIVSSVMAVTYWMGWSLGTAESIALVILIGFSVDYTVHLGHQYLDAPSKFRHPRVRHMLGHMAVTVLAGAATTLGSAIFLFGAQITFFGKFALIMMATILFSLLWSLGFFTACCALIGPENDQGSLIVAKDWLMTKLGKTTSKSGTKEENGKPDENGARVSPSPGALGAA